MGFFIFILLYFYYEPYPATDTKEGALTAPFSVFNSIRLATMKENADEIIKAIKDVYQRDIFTMGEIEEILTESGYKSYEIREIVRSAIKSNQMGRITYKNIGHSFPHRNSYVVIRPKPKPKSLE